MSMTMLKKIKTDAIGRYGKTLGDYSVFFRTVAEAVESEPNCVYDYIHHLAFKTLYQLRSLSALDFFNLYEALAYGDIGVLFASPRTCLSGILMQWIGSIEQQEEYFSIIKETQSRSFFATSEPNAGSDVSQIKTKFDLNTAVNQLIINGEKILVGNLGVANVGVIIGRTSNTLLGISAAWMKPEDFSNNQDRVSRGTLPLFGITPSLLGYAEFKDFSIPVSQYIGYQKKPMERGLHAIVKTFNVMRLGIAGLALGHAASVIDYIAMKRSLLSQTELLRMQKWQMTLSALRNVASNAGARQLTHPLESTLISFAKMRACHLAEEVCTQALSFFKGEVLFEHPFLMKRLRDCFGYEYMDGTTNIQRHNIYQGYLNDHLANLL
jgi:acyl-CoA dehydrogenase